MTRKECVKKLSALCLLFNEKYRVRKATNIKHSLIFETGGISVKFIKGKQKADYYIYDYSLLKSPFTYDEVIERVHTTLQDRKTYSNYKKPQLRN